MNKTIRHEFSNTYHNEQQPMQAEYPDIDKTTPINQLYHHGILGMKWGRRRFQNDDGTRTPAGKKREAEQRDDIPPSDDHAQSRADKKKATKGLSNAELKRLNERMQLEKTYKELSESEKKKNESAFKTLFTDVSKTVMKDVATTLGLSLAEHYVTDKLLNKLEVDKKKKK